MNFKNPFNKQSNSQPLPRLKGNAEQRPDGTWTWALDVFAGEDYSCSMRHPESAPGFISKETAIMNMKEYAINASNTIAKEVYGIKATGFFDLVSNQFVSNE